MADSTLLALLTVVSMLCTVAMAALTYKINEDWANHCDKMNERWYEWCETLNNSWYRAFESHKDKQEGKHDC